MLISRMREDPNSRFRPNLYARTMGFYGHTPKYWKCSGTNFDGEWAKLARFYTDRPQWHIDFEREQREAHSQCKKNKRHMSYVGYLKWVGPKNTYTWWFMGGGPEGRAFQKYRSGSIIFLGKPLSNK